MVVLVGSGGALNRARAPGCCPAVAAGKYEAAITFYQQSPKQVVTLNKYPPTEVQPFEVELKKLRVATLCNLVVAALRLPEPDYGRIVAMATQVNWGC